MVLLAHEVSHYDRYVCWPANQSVQVSSPIDESCSSSIAPTWDFGIYRIMNHKRDAVERFITEQLPASISAELDSGPLAEQNKAANDLAEAAQSIRAVAP